MRSGLAHNHHLFVLNSPGTIDAVFRGNIGVILANFSDRDYTIEPGDHIAQMVLSCAYAVEWQQVDTLPSSARGEGKFGHTRK
jgi:dUTP pyrophosphatase